MIPGREAPADVRRIYGERLGRTILEGFDLALGPSDPAGDNLVASSLLFLLESSLAEAWLTPAGIRGRRMRVREHPAALALLADEAILAGVLVAWRPYLERELAPCPCLRCRSHRVAVPGLVCAACTHLQEA